MNEYKTDIAKKYDNVDKREDVVIEADRSNRLLGLAFARDCFNGSAVLKLNTIEDKLFNKYFRLIKILKEMRGGDYGLEKK